MRMIQSQALPAFAMLLWAMVPTAAAEEIFDDPMFRRCFEWMTKGQRCALIGNLCRDVYALPPPSLVICARKIVDGFDSELDQQGCALVFEDYAKKTKEGHVR